MAHSSSVPVAQPVVSNWFGDLVTHPAVVVDAHSVDDIVAIMKDPDRYPAPVRALGSYHSTAPCGGADGGTIIRMSGMSQVLDISADSLTAQAGAIYIDLAEQLEQQQLQHYVNTEIGNLSLGSAACAGTKDASMPGEFGQVGSYVSDIKMVLPSGDLLEVSDAQPGLMQQVRSSYGTFGIVYEATLRVRPLIPLSVRHQTYTLEEFAAQLPALQATGESLMFYIFPFDGLITVEFRHYNPDAEGPPNRALWKLRNYLWATAGPAVCAQAERDIDIPEIRYAVIDGFNALWRFKLTNMLNCDNTVAADQIIRYPTVAGASKYTFTLWAFAEQTYPAVISDCFDFCRTYYQQTGYRNNMLFVGYRIAQDQSSLLSYSYDGNAITIDPVSTANPGWDEFLAAYNQFCSDRGGIPLLNQTYGLTKPMVQKALGDRWKAFADARKTYDPGNRLLSSYFKDLLGELA
jgi:FAD/FMN-containing dehydrogenase